MKCPNCQQEISSGNICSGCGTNAAIFMKACAASNSLYNKGLDKIRLKDLSGAIDCLSRSLAFNRKNINARNLLGLIYFEIGECAEALRHWVISTSISPDDNLASGYMEKIQARTRELDRYNDAIKMYNQAIVYVEQKSEDMAIIQLRKAVDINPKFVLAMNLLAFCYLIQKEKERARLLIERVLAIDTNNAIALNYLVELGISRQRTDSVQKSTTARQPQVTVSQSTGGYKRLSTKDKKSFSSTFRITEIIFFILGGACVFALYYTMIMPSMLETRDTAIDRLKTENATEAQVNLEAKARLEEQISELNDEILNREKLNAQLAEELTRHEKIQEAYVIITMFGSGLIEEAAEEVFSFDTNGLPADVLDKLLTVREQSFAQTAQTNYNAGAQDYNARRFDDAKIKLGKTLKFAAPDANYTHNTIYLLALIAENHDRDVEEAIRYYQMIVSNYPNSNRYNQAADAVRRLSD